MKIFISWSGERSMAVAVALKMWLPFIFQDVESWMSDHDINAGSRWANDVNAELESSNFGVLCLTPENIRAPWMLFEAGSLAKTVQVARVVPYRLDLNATDVEPPLSQFQGVNADEDGTFRLLLSINDARAVALSRDMLQQIFEMWWPKLKDKLDNIPSTSNVFSQQRSDRALLEETLQLVRRIQARIFPIEYELATISTEDLLQYLGQETEKQADISSIGDGDISKDKKTLAELELQRRLPNIFKRESARTVEE
jgi:TIR domain